METASRTLVKSPPEVWEQLDHPGRMEGLMSALVGHATTVEVYEREEESKLAWRAGDEARIEVELAEKGWGTNVSVSAENGDRPTKLEGWLHAVLEELATPKKRPFEAMSGSDERPAPVEIPPVAEPDEAPGDEEPFEEAPPEEPAVAKAAEPEPEAESEAPAAEPAPVEPQAPARQKLRRFFRF
jgi:hypothetical protein